MSVSPLMANPAGSLGPWMATLVGVTLMMGIITTQSTRYFSTFGFESRWLFGVVVISLGLILVQWIAILQLAWTRFVIHFGDNGSSGRGTWQIWFITIIGQASVFTAQLFFAHRCYNLYNRNKLIVAGLISAMLISLTLFMVMGVHALINHAYTDLVKKINVPAYGANLLTDLAIAGLMLWRLRAGDGQNFCPNTEDVLRRLRNLAIEAAVPPAMGAILSISLFLPWGGKNLIFLPFAMITPSLYVSSLMFTLNSRRSIRRKLNAPNNGGFSGGAHDLSNVLELHPKVPNSRRESRRATIVFAATTGPTSAPNASMGIIDERIEGSKGPDFYDGKSGYDEDDEPTSPGASHKELQVDLDQWEDETHSGPTYSRPTSIHPEQIPEPPPVPTSSEDSPKRPA